MIPDDMTIRRLVNVPGTLIAEIIRNRAGDEGSFYASSAIRPAALDSRRSFFQTITCGQTFKLLILIRNPFLSC